MNKPKYILAGKATHFRPSNKPVTACGIVGSENMIYDARDCDCLRCKKTNAYKVYMGIK